MEEQNNRSSGALQEPVQESSKPLNEEDEENRGKEMKKIDEQRQVSNNSGCTVDNTSTGERGESGGSRLKTLASVPLSKDDLQFDESYHLLSEVPVEYSLQPLQSVKEAKDQVKEVHEEPSICSTGPTAQLQIQHQTQIPDGASRLELSPTSVTQTMSAISRPSQPERKLQQVINRNKSRLTEEGTQNSPWPVLSSVPMPKTPDGYTWRKYGQKQVKSPEGSRSYYRCTFSDCYAKKIECSDRSNRVTETVYRSHHNHDPPRKLNCNTKNRSAIPIATISGSTDATHPVAGVNVLVPSTFKEPLRGIGKMPEAKQQESNGSYESTEVNAKDEYADGPEYKKREKRISTDELESLPRPEYKPKFMVHAAGDVSMSGDGYRWRKYGQKMVKGNPHPRNYYRCTSAGCPVRKHIERAVDSTSALIITYKGGHNHDMPVPRKRKSAPPISGTSDSGDILLINKTETSQSQKQYSTEKEGKVTGESLNLGGKKALEPPRTLLSIGFEIKPY